MNDSNDSKNNLRWICFFIGIHGKACPEHIIITDIPRKSVLPLPPPIAHFTFELWGLNIELYDMGSWRVDQLIVAIICSWRVDRFTSWQVDKFMSWQANSFISPNLRRTNFISPFPLPHLPSYNPMNYPLPHSLHCKENSNIEF